jgi:hypothetical protein
MSHMMAEWKRRHTIAGVACVAGVAGVACVACEVGWNSRLGLPVLGDGRHQRSWGSLGGGVALLLVWVGRVPLAGTSGGLL